MNREIIFFENHFMDFYLQLSPKAHMTQNLKNAKNFNELVELKYGHVGQPARDEFEKDSQRFLIAELLKVFVGWSEC